MVSVVKTFQTTRYIIKKIVTELLHEIYVTNHKFAPREDPSEMKVNNAGDQTLCFFHNF